MDTLKTVVVSALVSSIVSLGIVLLLGGNGGDATGAVSRALNVDAIFGSITSNGDFSAEGETVVDGFTQGGGIVSLTDANGGTYTLTQAELLAGHYLSFQAGGAGQAVIALQLPATSTLTTLIASAGDCREWIYDSSALAAATTTTITAGAGMDLLAYTTNDDVIDGGEYSELRMCRQADGDVTVFTTEMLNAD